MSTPPWPPTFTLDQERILSLLTGDRFYSNPSAALREAILNAIDAVHRRRHRKPDLPPDIRVTFNRDNLRLTLADNGLGMDRQDVSVLFTKVGASAATAETHTDSVGEFGIGVISYFMAADVFSLQTYDGTTTPLGLSFSREMLAGGEATSLSPTRNCQGTTLVLHLRDMATFDLLLAQFPHWCRDVEGLSAELLPDRRTLAQMGTYAQDDGLDIDLPNWVDRAHLRPVSNPPGWDAMTEVSTVAVLYRGVFVQEFNVEGAWGIEGSIDVDPKHFKPRLNRESFVESQFQEEVTQLLKSCHPAILEAISLWQKSIDRSRPESTEWRRLGGMAMGKKPAARQPSPMWVTTADLPTSAGHPFFERLNRVLEEAGFDAFVEGLCAVFYASRLGRPSLRPGRYFRLLFIGYFEGLSSERGIAWRVADSLSLRAFLDLDVTEAPPNHSTLSRTRRLIDVETHVAVFTWVLERLAGAGLAQGKTVGVDATTLEANAAMRSIERRDTGESYEAFVRQLAKASGIETPTRAELARFDRSRKDRKTSNKEWQSPQDPDAKIAKMKDGRTHLAHKAEHGVDLETGAILSVTVQGASEGDSATLPETLTMAAEQVEAVQPAGAEVEEVVADKGYHSDATLVALDEIGVRSYVSEPERGRGSLHTPPGGAPRA